MIFIIRRGIRFPHLRNSVFHIWKIITHTIVNYRMARGRTRNMEGRVIIYLQLLKSTCKHLIFVLFSNNRLWMAAVQLAGDSVLKLWKRVSSWLAIFTIGEFLCFYQSWLISAGWHSLARYLFPQKRMLTAKVSLTLWLLKPPSV